MLGYPARHPPKQTPPSGSRHPLDQAPPIADTTTPRADTPPRPDTLQTRHPPPGTRHPTPKAMPPRPGTPWAQTPFCAVQAGRYDQQAGGMHPTGMQSFCKYYYCPQTKFVKVMFSQASVILFTSGGVSRHAPGQQAGVTRGVYTHPIRK